MRVLSLQESLRSLLPLSPLYPRTRDVPLCKRTHFKSSPDIGVRVVRRARSFYAFRRTFDVSLRVLDCSNFNVSCSDSVPERGVSETSDIQKQRVVKKKPILRFVSSVPCTDHASCMRGRAFGWGALVQRLERCTNEPGQPSSIPAPGQQQWRSSESVPGLP